MIILFSSTQIVGASTQISLGTAYRENTPVADISGRYENTVNRPQDRIIEHSTGKFCILSYDAYNVIRLKILDVNGAVLYSQVIIQTTDFPRGGVTLKEYNTTNILIVYGRGDGSVAAVYFINFNINTFNSATAHINLSTVSGATSIDRLGQLYYYNDYWCILALYDSYSSGARMEWAKYRVSTHVASGVASAASAHYGYTESILSFQDPLNLNLVYYVRSSVGSDTTPEYHVFDINTNTDSLLATGGSNGMLPAGSDHTYSQPYTNMINYIGGGIYISGTHYYLYHTWVFSQPPTSGTAFVRQYLAVMWVGDFNNTITSGGLLVQTTRTYTMTDDSLGTFHTPGTSWGFMESTTLPEIKMKITYNRYWLGSYMATAELKVSDITNSASNLYLLDLEGRTDGLYLSYIDASANVMKNPTNTWSYQEVDDSTSYLFLNEAALLISMTEALVISPADNPMIQSKTYSLTWTIYKNGLADYDGDTYRFRFDGTVAKTGVLDGSGKAIISLTCGLTGTHTVSIDIWNDTAHTQLYEGTVHSYNFVASTVPPGGGGFTNISTGWYTLFVLWVPILGFIFVPMVTLAILGARFAGPMGAMIGMLSGGFVGTISGVVLTIIPMYVLLLYLLLMGVSFAMMFRGGGGSGGA